MSTPTRITVALSTAFVCAMLIGAGLFYANVFHTRAHVGMGILCTVFGFGSAFLFITICDLQIWLDKHPTA